MLSAAGLLLTSAVVIAPAASASTPFRGVSVTSSASVRSTTAKTLKLAVIGTRGAAASSAGSLTVSLTRGAESHLWTFRFPGRDLKLAGSGGRLSLGSAISPYGTVNLSFTARGRSHKVSCGSSYSIAQPGRVSGRLYFDTRSTGSQRWGAVGSRTRTFSGSAYLMRSYGSSRAPSCTGPVPVTACATNVSWAASGNGVFLSGGYTVTSRGKKVGHLAGIRMVRLSKPRGAMRDDTVQTSSSPPTLTRSGANAKLAVRGSGGLASGSATLTSRMPGYASPAKCGHGRTERTQTWLANYANGRPALTVRAQIFGAFTVSRAQFATVSSTTA